MLYSLPVADVAQPVEQRFRNAWVGGSSPSIGTISEEEKVVWCGALIVLF